MLQEKCQRIKTFAKSLTFTDKSREMILGSTTIQTMPKQDGMLVVTQ